MRSIPLRLLFLYDLIWKFQKKEIYRGLFALNYYFCELMYNAYIPQGQNYY